MNDRQLINLAELPLKPALGSIVRKLQKPLEWGLGIRSLSRTYHDRLADVPAEDIWPECARALGVASRIEDGDLERIPESGPLVMIANHPFGGVDGVLLMELLRRRRGDVKVLANEVLRSIPQMAADVIPVDVYTSGNRMKNARNLQLAIRHVRDGGALLVFPAGAVAHFNWKRMKVTECPWSAHIGAIIRKSGATVLPAHVHGRNSLLYQAVGSLNAVARSLMLIREMVNKRGRSYRVDIGMPIPAVRLSGFEDDAAMMRYLRDTVDFMRAAPRRKRIKGLRRAATGQDLPEVIGPVDRDLLEGEIAALPDESLLVERGDYSVHVARAPQIPSILREIGRLREISYRDVEEGSGNDCDLDEFDGHYLHLFVWDKAAREIAGAYRLGQVDRILKERGSSGLYSTRLFRYEEGFLDEVGDAVELGRSFIQPAYRESHGVLPLLWKGICLFAVRNPRYRKLFGAVSISNGYRRRSRNLMVEFLRQNNWDPELASMVRARTPYRVRRGHRSIRGLAGGSARDLNDISMAISSVEKDCKGIPVLIKHYLKMDARFLSFNLDRQFSDVVDGLIVVNLDHSNDRMIRHYMGAEGFDRFRRAAMAG